MHVRLGSRVYYRDNGPEDAGTVVDILLSEYPFVVRWDRQSASRFESRKVELLGETVNFVYNPADENIDQFAGVQLGLLEY